MIVYLRNIHYLLIEEQAHTPELGTYTTFGILGIRRTFRGYQQTAYVRDVSTDRAFVSGLVERCNREKLSPTHLQDFIADVLGS